MKPVLMSALVKTSPNEQLSNESRRQGLTEDGVLLAVVLLTVQAQQSAVVKVFYDSFELVTERTPPLQRHRDTG